MPVLEDPDQPPKGCGEREHIENDRFDRHNERACHKEEEHEDRCEDH